MGKLVKREDKQVVKTLDVNATIEEFLRLEVAAGKASPNTIRNYKNGIRDFLAWCKSNNLNPLELKHEDIIRYRENLNSRLAPATVALKLQAVRRFYEAMISHNMAVNNPAKLVKAPKDNTAREEKIKYIRAVDITALLKSVDTQSAKGKRDKAMLALMVIHGLRASEVSGLDCLDLDNETLSVLGKGRKKRTIYLIPKTVNLLVAWLAVRESESKYVFVNFARSRSSVRGRLTTRSIERVVDFYLNESGLKKEGVSCHALRHSFATLALSEGASLEAIRDSLGHASVKTTEVYAKVLDKERNNPALKLINLLD